MMNAIPAFPVLFENTGDPFSWQSIDAASQGRSRGQFPNAREGSQALFGVAPFARVGVVIHFGALRLHAPRLARPTGSGDWLASTSHSEFLLPSPLLGERLQVRRGGGWG
jgi:hypothetical protein